MMTNYKQGPRIISMMRLLVTNVLQFFRFIGGGKALKIDANKRRVG